MALGVFAGAIAAGVFLRACDVAMDEARLDQANKQFVAGMARATDKSNGHFQQAEQQTDAAEQARQAAAIARLRAAMDAGAQATASRNAAWQRYYRRPKECENPPTEQAFIECGNRAIQAREQFEKAYQP